ncbi:MAG: UDP-glucose dehydrogenase family protein [Desulfovibrionaceae bacterium]
MRLAIIGSGYVGLVTGACLADTGNIVHCVDINESVIRNLCSGIIPIYEPYLTEMIQKNVREKRLSFTTDLESILHLVDCVFICVGTPTKIDGSCDMQYIYAVAKQIGQKLNRDSIIVTKSTVPVGTSDIVKEIIFNELKERGLSYYVSFVSNPEFLKEGDAINDFLKPDRIIIGTEDDTAFAYMKELYKPFGRSKNKIVKMSIRSAEMTKYAANAMLATKISFINEIANMCEIMGADVEEVRYGIGSDHRIGNHFIYPGLGYGGSCFPKDVQALIHMAKEHSFNAALLESVHSVNTRQKYILSKKIKKFFEDKGGVRGKIIALWGLSFKPNTDDMREAPSLVLIDDLVKEGAYIVAFDPVANEKARMLFKDNLHVSILSDMYQVCENADVLCVATEWNAFAQPDFMLLSSLLRERCIFDGRNMYSTTTLMKYGIQYISIGRGAV